MIHRIKPYVGLKFKLKDSGECEEMDEVFGTGDRRDPLITPQYVDDMYSIPLHIVYTISDITIDGYLYWFAFNEGLGYTWDTAYIIPLSNRNFLNNFK